MSGAASVTTTSAGFALAKAAQHHHLVILAILRNECKIMLEWLMHHIWQGVDHFFLIDNASTDKACIPDIKRTFDQYVTFFHWQHTPRTFQNGSNQLAAYEHAYPAISADWVLISDLDEFAFGVNTTVDEVLATAPPNTSQICMPWVRFGSSNLTHTPRCVTKSNLWREPLWQKEPLVGKCFTRGDKLLSSGLQVHRAVVTGDVYRHRGANCVCGDMKTPCRRGFPTSQACKISQETQRLQQHLLLYHYQVQSQQHMRESSGRGDVNIKGMMRTGQYWFLKERQFNQVYDDTLAQKSICPNGTVDLHGMNHTLKSLRGTRKEGGTAGRAHKASTSTTILQGVVINSQL